MIIRQVKKGKWEHVYSQIIKYGRALPLSSQFDIDINCNGVNYILKIQPEKNRTIAALQALGVYPDGKGLGCKRYLLIEENIMISALLEILIYQGVNKRN